jgi:hypothetical protein
LYNTPNIRLITLADFERFCRQQHVEILEKVALTIGDGKKPRILRCCTDWRGEFGIFLLGRKDNGKG